MLLKVCCSSPQSREPLVVLLVGVSSLSSLFNRVTWLRAYSCLQQWPRGVVGKIGSAAHINTFGKWLVQWRLTAGHQAVFTTAFHYSISIKCSFNGICCLIVYVHFYIFSSSQQLPITLEKLVLVLIFHNSVSVEFLD